MHGLGTVVGEVGKFTGHVEGRHADEIGQRGETDRIDLEVVGQVVDVLAFVASGGNEHGVALVGITDGQGEELEGLFVGNVLGPVRIEAPTVGQDSRTIVHRVLDRSRGIIEEALGLADDDLERHHLGLGCHA